ncbi:MULTISPECIES: O-antigen ligase family protein [unclassified Enterococcus]|uniref:O-antigen ligase family protein n=1 Tax=unclassified Enterococcus TaxID=2608891 RepID=UPI001CE0A079|nr:MULTISPECIES: O-antigen ligase family protein [unclassified Enterococcus]MCA5014438.1 O-antigen ligase family protein [Enterococcus sp. S23]MCA5017448.1 O-antigen ligase family protein [Enterococcus sp. S22(2020)]
MLKKRPANFLVTRLLVIALGIFGSFFAPVYLLIPLIFGYLVIREATVEQLLDYVFWLTIVAIFFGAYLSVPSYENLYLFRFLLPVYGVLAIISNSFDFEQFKQYKVPLISLMIYFGVSLITLVWAPKVNLGFRYTYFVLEIFFIFFMSFKEIKTKQRFDKVMDLIFIVYLINLAVGIYEILSGNHLKLSGANLYVTTTIKYQPTGFLFNPNDFALFLAGLYPLVVVVIQRRFEPLKRDILYAVVTLLTLYIIVSTYSRIGMLSIGISVVATYGYIYKKNGFIAICLFLPPILLGAYSLGIGTHIWDIAYSSFSDKQNSTSARENMYLLLWQICKDSRFMGVGAGNSPYVLNSLMLGYFNTGEASYTTGHNFILETIANVGIFGFLGLFGGVIGSYSVQLIKNIMNKITLELLCSGLVLIAFMGSTIALSTILEKRFLWFMLALGLVMINKSKLKN